MTDIQSKPENKNPDLKEKEFKFEKYKFKAELFKWFIGSVALVIITVIIDKGFKERTAGIQEMQAYDKYVEVILKANNIEERWKLSKYFSIVTPTERLRQRWTAYKDSIKGEYLEFKALKETEFELIRQKNDSQSKDTLFKIDKKINEIQHKLVPFENKLINTNDILQKMPDQRKIN